MPLILLNNELEPIREDYCSWEVSELLRKLGFNMLGVLNPYANMCYEHDNTLKLIPAYRGNTTIGYTLAPTHAYACKWLMVNLGVYVGYTASSPFYYRCVVKAKWDRTVFHLKILRDAYPDPALAMEDALLYILKEL